jgi:peptidyl-tRNA hydrolase
LADRLAKALWISPNAAVAVATFNMLRHMAASPTHKMICRWFLAIQKKVVVHAIS